jgi:hypothetical protein
MSRETVRRLKDAGMLLIGTVALLALALLSLQGWGRVYGGSGDAATADGEHEGQTVPRDQSEQVMEQTDEKGELLGEDGLEDETLPVVGVTSASDVSVRSEAGEVEQVATRLLTSYRDQRDCVLAEAGYLDLLGSVWGCVVQGDQWVDVCVIEQVDEASCQVHVMRFDASEVAKELDAGAVGSLVSNKEGDG